jgi:selenocysteine lyase/cysteine desulfurase
MDRREFLLSTGAAAALLGCKRTSNAPAASPTSKTPPTPGSPGNWKDIKGEFTGLAPSLVHMTGFFLVSHPRSVREAIEGHRKAFDDNPVEYLEQNIKTREVAVRAAAAQYLGADANDIAMTDSTTMGLGLVYGGMQLAPGQEILSSTHDHIVTTMACKHRAARTGAPFRQVPLYDDPSTADASAIVERLAAAIKPETRVVAITWVHSGTGVKLPIRAIADRLAKINASRGDADRVLLCVDGVHGFGIEDVNPPDLGCDFFIAGCHKWIFGPRGTGLVWARKESWPATMPTIPSMDLFWRGGTLETMPPAGLMTPGGFHSFEHRWALENAFQFHLGIGKAKIAARLHELNAHLKAELVKMPHVKLVTPRSQDLSAGINCFLVDGMKPDETVAALRKANVVASTTPPFYATSYARLAASLLTVEEDVDKALAAVRQLRA